MILQTTLGILAVVSFGLTLWQWLVARRFPLHQRCAGLRSGALPEPMDANEPGRRPALPSPAVTLLKPLKDADEHTEACLRSWFNQDYPGDIQILFGVETANDPACAVVNKLLAEFPQRDAKLILCPEPIGANAKVAKLAQLEPHAKHELLVVSDADVRVPPDLLANVVLPLTPALSMNRNVLPGILPAVPAHGENVSSASGTPGSTLLAAGPQAAPQPGFWGSTREYFRGFLSPSDGKRVAGGPGEGNVGLANCFYQLADPATPAMRWEAIAINADFWSQVLQSRSLKPLDFALGAVMATRRRHLAEIGGFRALADCAADDYQLGQRIARRGRRIELCPVVVECLSAPMSWSGVWRHQLRWARTIRVCEPLPYFLSILSNATLWPLLWLAVQPSLEIFEFVQVFLAVRIISALYLQKWLTHSIQGMAWWWLVPVKDLLQAVIWAAAFLGNRIEWRGDHYLLRRDGAMEKL